MSALESEAYALIAQGFAKLAEAAKLRTDERKPDFYTSSTWPGGAKNFRRMIASGKLAAVKIGREWLVRREDGDVALTPRRNVKSTIEMSDEDIVAGLRRAGIRVGPR